MPSGGGMLRLQSEISAMRLKVSAMRLALAFKYNPDQPREPPGSPGGGRWVGSGGGAASSGSSQRSPSDSEHVRTTHYERGQLINRYGKIGGANWCVYRFSFGDVAVPGPTERACPTVVFPAAVSHGQLLNDNFKR